MEKKLNIEVTVEELNYILLALSEKPYKDVVVLINNIRTQGMEQVKESTLEESE